MYFYQRNKHNYGTTTRLTLGVQNASTLIILIFAAFCFIALNIRGTLFYTLIGFSIINGINTLSFYKHKNLEVSFNVAAILAYVVVLIVSLNTGGINSSFNGIFVLLIFFGYVASRFYGNLWFIVITLTIIALYVLEHSSIQLENSVSSLNNTEFNLFINFLMIALLGGAFGLLVHKNFSRIRSAKKEIALKDQEKAVMLKEIHHRVKNNLHVVNSLLRIQSRLIKDEDVKSMFSVAQSRIVAMARLHEKIYKTDNLKHIDIQNHFTELVNDLIATNNLNTSIRVIVKISNIYIPINTLLPLCLILNEVVSNSLKHAFKDQEIGVINIGIQTLTEDLYQLIISDNGIGYSGDLLNTKAMGTGMRLIKSLVKQIGGDITLQSNEEGISYCIKIPIESEH